MTDMDDVTAELNELFAGASPDGLPKDVLAELQSILRVHSIPPQELFYKWESYCLKMGSEETKLNLETVRLFKRDVQETLERESRGRAGRQTEKRSAVIATPRAANTSDVFGMLDGLTPSAHGRTPNGANGSAKRKSNFGSPSTLKVGKGNNDRSPNSKPAPVSAFGGSAVDGIQSVPFSERPNPGQTLETLNAHLSMPEDLMVPFSEARIRPTANTDLKKFGYKPMAMRVAEASEILDDRIDEFTEMYEKQYETGDISFGSAATQSTSEIIAVGRVASDSLEGKLNTASLVLETSRRTGAGLRVPLNLDSIPSANFFPGQIVALRGINASGNYFTVKEVLSPPLLPPAASSPVDIESINQRLDEAGSSSPLNVFIASGPYTADDNLGFEPLQEICQKAAESYADSFVLMGPFLDIEHPLLASGDLDLPEIQGIDPDTATLTTVFRHCIAAPLQKLAAAVPSITIVMIPSVRDALSKHVSWPQERLPKKELGLPKQVRMVSNPVTLSFNETVIGMCSYDVLYDLRREEVLHGRPKEGNLLTRLPKYLIEQRHFMPLFPSTARENLPRPGTENGTATGAMLDVSYFKLGEWWNVRPDVLITPSLLPPFVKLNQVVDSVLVINPGTLSKRRAAGTYTQMAIHPRVIADDEREQKHLSHKLYERARVDIIRI
ncbi:DNA-directed DNA polymerase alpha subunit POL12 [Aspergillus clavatus NRRL 1]|uniref:DNA polymerase alpha subunit B n=1 Tax=Aspergillus clavatus (strain ATCC 1007 / CBS 513.65 / DSM 816 / NCTC 3887 / NRRL 1 / QM 1276 / 107) TaxID=344612 RepID=A1CBN6_ASPCL|nr:DNA polymerase alpha/primase associated subunit [Aspergillus clavatus NRRL 1]EAW13154.1 DNA polymerase alpha/primase associated subunit [Aspergillus clavatus NRRL 1]